MSGGTPTGPDEGAPMDPREPSDLLEPEGLGPDREDASDEHAEHYDVESLPRGTQLGRYVLLGRISERSSEVVYGAYDPEGDRKVSLKLFHPGGDDDDEQAHRTRMSLVRQAQALAKLSHPCVERIYEAGIYGPWVFLATEFIDGIDLRHWMEARDDPFPWPEVLRVFREAGRGLAAAHKAGSVHRDFRPANVLMGKEGRLVVVDFGLAPEVEEAADDIELSELRESLVGTPPIDDTSPSSPSTLMAGTPAYMAPEQHVTGHADARSDQFSFCVALYEALYGERPFSGNRPRAIALEAAKHNVRPPPPGSTVPGWLRAAVVRGLSPRPDERFPSMEALLRELARDPAASRRRWGWGAAVALGLAGAGTLMAMQLEADRSVCDAEGDALAEAWTPARRAALRGAFEATGRSWADPTWRYAEAKLDTWADEWRDLSRRACMATRVWGDAAERTYELRQACLARHLVGLEATLEVLEDLDGPALDRAHALVQQLPPPRQCADTNTLLSLGLPLEDHRDDVEALHRELAGLEARLALGRTIAVLRDATARQVRVEAPEAAPLIARGRLLLGRARLAASEPDAEAALHEAARAALEAGHPHLAVQAWSARMEALRREGRGDEALTLGDYVEAMLVHKRLGWLRPALDITRGDAERSRDRAAEALARYHGAIEHEQARPDPDPLRLLPAWRGQAAVLVARDDVDEAAPPLQTALEVTRDALGPMHPAAIEVLQDLGRVQQRRGQLSEARAHFEQALELVRKVDAGNDERVAELEAAVGSLYAAEGDPERARDHLERAFTAAGGTAAAERTEGFRLGVMLAHAQRDAGDVARALELLEAVLAPRRAAPYPAPRSEAVGEQPSTAERVDAELAQASLLWDSGEAERARALVEGVGARLDDTTAHQVYRDDVTRWLEEHVIP